MNAIHVLIDVMLVVALGYTAGCLNAMIDYNKIDGVKTPWFVWVLKYLSIGCAIFLAISIYGMGVSRCLHPYY
jgi:hypothetical protein